jgi:molybdenum cofactor biosynthesis protein B
MVDFQSRDTRRTLGEDEEEGDGEDEAGAGTADAEGETAPDSGAVDPDSETDTATATDSAIEGGEEASDAVPVPEEMTYALVTVGSPTGDIDPADAAVPALDGTEARVVTRRSVETSLDAVQSTVGDLVDRPEVAAVVTFGGVGVGPGDVTPGAVEPLFDKRMDGFGELYRVLAHEREGTAVVRARVTAGLVGDVPVFCLPGDPDAARHGVEGLVLAEAEAIAEEATGGDSPEDV